MPDQAEGSPIPRAPSPFRTRAFLLKAVFGSLITLALVLLLTHFVEWRELRTLSSQARWPILLCTFFFYFTMYLLRAWRFRLLAPQSSYKTLLAITCVHNFMLRILPMRTGELSYGFLMRRANAAGLGESLLGLLLLRLIDVTVVVVTFGVTLALTPQLYQGDKGMAAWIAFGLTLLGLATVLFFRPLSLLGLWLLQGGLRLCRLDRLPRVTATSEKLAATVRGFHRLSYGSLLALFAQSVGIWLSNYALVFVLMRGFAIPLTFGKAVLGGTSATVSGFLPVGGIGSFGTLEAGWTLGFALVGINTSQAVASGFAFSLITLFWAGLLALGGWFALGRLAKVGPTRP